MFQLPLELNFRKYYAHTWCVQAAHLLSLLHEDTAKERKHHFILSLENTQT